MTFNGFGKSANQQSDKQLFCPKLVDKNLAKGFGRNYRKFVKTIQVCQNYSSMKLSKYVITIQVCQNYPSMSKLSKYVKTIQVCQNYPSTS
jgi:hypothetical protein